MLWYLVLVLVCYRFRLVVLCNGKWCNGNWKVNIRILKVSWIGLMMKLFVMLLFCCWLSSLFMIIICCWLIILFCVMFGKRRSKLGLNCGGNLWMYVISVLFWLFRFWRKFMMRVLMLVSVLRLFCRISVVLVSIVSCLNWWCWWVVWCSSLWFIWLVVWFLWFSCWCKLCCKKWWLR